eukprot:3746975-Pleurochrysis_carterae.AAC.1
MNCNGVEIALHIIQQLCKTQNKDAKKTHKVRFMVFGFEWLPDLNADDLPGEEKLEWPNLPKCTQGRLFRICCRLLMMMTALRRPMLLSD